MLDDISTEDLFRAIITRIHNQRLEYILKSPFIYDRDYSVDEFVYECQNILRDMGTYYNHKVFQTRKDILDKFEQLANTNS